MLKLDNLRSIASEAVLSQNVASHSLYVNVVQNLLILENSDYRFHEFGRLYVDKWTLKSLVYRYIPPWKVVVLHIGVRHSLTPMCKTTTTPQVGI